MRTLDRLTVCLPPQDREGLVRAAAEERRPVSNLAAHVLAEWLARRQRTEGQVEAA